MTMSQKAQPPTQTPRPSSEPGRKWWQRKIVGIPLSLWIIGFGGLVVLGGLLNQSDGEATPTGTAAQQSDEQRTTEGLDIPDTTTGFTPDPVPIPATPELAGCTIASPTIVDAAEDGLVGNLTLSLTYTTTDDMGREVLGASLYRPDDGWRVSSSDLWIVEDGEMFALTGSANEYSTFPDARDLVEFPIDGEMFLETFQNECLIPAIRATAS